MARNTQCESCRGTGEVGYADGPEFVVDECHHCSGSGVVIECDGPGCHEILAPDHDRNLLFPAVDLCDACLVDMRTHVEWYEEAV